MWQNRRAEVDNNNQIEPAKIDAEQMVKHNNDIEFFYKLVMLSDKKNSLSAKERVDKAFRNIGKSEDDEKQFTKYVLGGLEFLYEQIAENTASIEDVFKKLCDLVDYAISNEISIDMLMDV